MSLSYCVSDVREDVLVSDVALRELRERLMQHFVRFCAASLVWYNCSIASDVVSVGGRSLGQLSCLADVRHSDGPQESVVFILSVRSAQTLTFLFLLFLLFLVNGIVQKLFQVTFLRKSKFFSNFVSDAAQPFFSVLVARCHPQDQDKQGSLAPESLGWDCCAGFRGLHRSVKGFQSDRSIAVKSSRYALDCTYRRSAPPRPSWDKTAAYPSIRKGSVSVVDSASGKLLEKVSLCFPVV